MTCLEKQLFITEREAIRFMLKIKKRMGIRQRVYNCDVCKGFHLTSRIFPYQERTI